MSGRNNKLVCTPCRSRKKKCDVSILTSAGSSVRLLSLKTVGNPEDLMLIRTSTEKSGQPTCSSCRKRNEHCGYTNASRALSTAVLTQAYSNGELHHDTVVPAQSSQLYTTDSASTISWPGWSMSSVAQDAPASISSGPQVHPSHDVMLSAPSSAHTDAWIPSFFGTGSNFSARPIVQTTRAGPSEQPTMLDDISNIVLHAPENADILLSPTTLSQNGIVSQQQTVELMELFSERFYSYLPIFHKLMPSVKSTALEHTCPLLLTSIQAVAAGFHPDSNVRALQGFLYGEAKTLYASTTHQPQDPLQTLQAAVCIILQALISGDHSVGWLVLGKAWRQAVALGFHHLDSTTTRNPPPGLSPAPSTDWRELEQRRRVLWALFVLDRGMCFPIGLAHAIDERQLRINLPLSEDESQGSSPVSLLVHKLSPGIFFKFIL